MESLNKTGHILSNYIKETGRSTVPNSLFLPKEIELVFHFIRKLDMCEFTHQLIDVTNCIYSRQN